MLLPLLNEEVRFADVAPDGTLAVGFAAGALRCLPGATHEAWDFTKVTGEMVVCMPGGALAVWSGRKRSQDA